MARKHQAKAEPRHTLAAAYQARRDQVKALVAEGKTCTEIGEALGVSRQRALQIIHKLGLQATLHSEQVQARNAEILRRYEEEGQDFGTIAAAMGCSRTAVTQVIHPCQRLHAQMVSLVAEGKTAQEIQVELGYASVSSVYAYLRLHGLHAVRRLAQIQALAVTHKQAIQRYTAKGKSAAEIQELLGLSRGHVNRVRAEWRRSQGSN